MTSISNAKILMINGREVQSLTLNSNHRVIYRKESEKFALSLTVTGNSFASYNSSPFTYSGTVMISYGDGTIETYTDGQISHTYDTSGTYTVNIYGELTSLNESCFKSVTNITSVSIGNSITSLGKECFAYCTGLTSITLGNSVTSLGEFCFFGCTGLTSVTLGNSVTSLGTWCFGACTGSTSLNIPSSVTSIGNLCFSGSTNLTLLYLYWTSSDDIITYSTSSWLNGSSISSFSIPSGTTDLYVAKNYPLEMLVEQEPLWKPILDGTNGARYQYSYSESNGVATGKGFTLNGGFPNNGLWELNFEFRHDNIQYTGIAFLCEPNVRPNTGTRLSTWEGTWPGGDRYATFSSGTIDWFDIKVTKLDDTHVRLQSTTLNRDTTVELTWLPNINQLSCGAVHNPAGSLYGPSSIRNVICRQII